MTLGMVLTTASSGLLALVVRATQKAGGDLSTRDDGAARPVGEQGHLPVPARAVQPRSPSSFGADCRAALSELESSVDSDWDVLLIGALGCVHPQCRYGVNVLHGLMGGCIRWPRRLSRSISIPARAFGTHAYVLSPAWRALALWFGAQFALIQALKVHSWWPPPIGRATRAPSP